LRAVQDPAAPATRSVQSPQVPAPEPQLQRLERLVPQEFARRLLNSRTGQVERERRIVTILFCDVKGSTALGAERDPEEVMEIMNGALDLLIEPVYRYEGTLARLMGDAILAFFGAPLAHEDDPERACLAALAMQARVAQYAQELKRTRGVEQFAVRVGINTGLVVVGEVGSDLRVEYTAMGDAINVASRLENAAAPGTILISETTGRMVQHAIALEALGGLALKGKSEPVNVYRVLGRKTTPGSARGIAGLAAPLVGRAHELNVLQEHLDSLLRGQGGMVTLVGEAGLGKSRLIAEARKQYAGPGESGIQTLQWLEGRCLSYETQTPNAPFIDLLNRWFELGPGGTDLEKYDRLCAQIQRVLPGRADEVAPFIATLLGIELIGEPLERVRYMMPPMLRGQVSMNLMALVGAYAASKPTVLVLDDVHWSDASSLELIGALSSLVSRVPLLLVLLQRPNKTDPAWQLHESLAVQLGPTHYTTIELQPLDEHAARELVASLLEIEDLPPAVRQLILDRAEGNPFYVEEVIRSLLDQKLVVSREDPAGGRPHWYATREIARIAIPDTLAGVITARLDRLDEEAKHTAQTASVIGRTFSFDVLADVFDTPQALEPSLDTLQSRELVRRGAEKLARDYLFKHALTQETAYNTLLKSKRTALHKRVGETLERLEPQNVDDIARHFTQANETERALPYLIAAGERAVRGFALKEAIDYFTHAVQVAGPGHNLNLMRRTYEGLGNALAFAGQLERALDVYREMFEAGEAHADVPTQVSALNKTANVTGMRQGQFPQAEQWLKQSEALAVQAQDRVGLAEAYTLRCQICQAQADFDGTIRFMQESVNIGRELNVKTQIAFGLSHIASAQMTMGDFAASYRSGQEALAVSLEIGDREHEAEVYINSFATYHLMRGEIDRALEYLERGLEISTKINTVFNLIIGNYLRGWIAMERGEYDVARASFEGSHRASAPLEQFVPMMFVIALAGEGSVYSAISPALADKAREFHDKALELLSQPAGIPGGGSAFPEIGFAALARGDLALAQDLFAKGANVPSILRNVMRPRSYVGTAMTLVAQGQADLAEPYIQQAREFLEARATRNFEPMVALAAGRVALARGDLDQALRESNRAEYYASEMNFRPYLWQARALAARVLTAQGQPDQAAARREQAHTVVDEIAARLSDESWRKLFLENALAQIE
jgi:class 3 adenylate cyclase/tetratricopeptide (TPR) repeat protein